MLVGTSGIQWYCDKKRKSEFKGKWFLGSYREKIKEKQQIIKIEISKKNIKKYLL